MPRSGGLKFDNRTTCSRCGEHIQILLDVFKNDRFKAYSMSGVFHHCLAKHKVKVFTDEEKKEFERKRLAGEI